MRTNEELAPCIQNGEARALEELWMQVKRLAYCMARRYTTTAVVGLDDLLQCAYIGMHAAALAYREGEGSFSTVLHWYVAKECRDALGLRGRPRIEAAASLDAPLGDDADGDTRLDLLADESLPDVTADTELEDLKADVHDAVDALPDDLRETICMRYFDGLPLEKIGKRMGLSPMQVRTREGRALQRLRHNRVLMVHYKPPEREFRLVSGYASGLAAFRNTGASCVEAEALHHFQDRPPLSYPQYGDHTGFAQF